MHLKVNPLEPVSEWGDPSSVCFTVMRPAMCTIFRTDLITRTTKPLPRCLEQNTGHKHERDEPKKKMQANIDVVTLVPP